jgi:phage host-nuclease inhibitor protein Gam
MAKPKEKKWAAYKRGDNALPEWVDPNPAFNEKVNEKRRTLGELTDVEIGVLLSSYKAEKNELEAQVKTLNVGIEACSRELTERFETANQQSMKLATGENFFLKVEPYSSIEDKMQVIQWLEDNGMKEMLAPNWKAYNALVKMRLEAGEEAPPGTGVYIKTTVEMRRG